MYYKWLDQRDEQRAQRGEEAKLPSAFRIDSHLAFPSVDQDTTIDEFCHLAEQSVSDGKYFDLPELAFSDCRLDGEWLTFPSLVATAVEQNNTVWARVTQSGAKNKVLVVFHHWNASKWQNTISKFFSRRGITVVEMAMPYHFQRSRPGADYADDMLSSNLGKTMQSVRQGVLDGRILIQWLKSEGYGEISVLGMSLGSWVAGLISAHDTNVAKTSLFLTAGSLADMVWEGRATRSIRQSLDGNIGRPIFQRAWAPLNMENYAHLLMRPELDLELVLGKRDKVVPPEISKNFVAALNKTGVGLRLTELNCGHYTLGLPQYIIRAGLKLNAQMNRSSFSL